MLNLTLDGLQYEIVKHGEIGGSPSIYRCFWDDRFLLANSLTQFARSEGCQISVIILGESLQNADNGIRVYMTATLTVCVAHESPIAPKISNYYLKALESISEQDRKSLRDGKYPIESLPPGWIDRGATASLRSPGTWFQSAKWDLFECFVSLRREWRLFSRPNDEPGGSFATKEEAFACADGVIPDGCIKVKVEPTREQLRTMKKSKFPMLDMVSKMYQEQESKGSDPKPKPVSPVAIAYADECLDGLPFIGFTGEPGKSPNPDPKQETWRDRKPLL